MIRLYLVRHGIAVDRSELGCPPEPERPLTPEGVEKTRAVARGMRILEISSAALLASPFLRAVQTAEIFAKEWGVSAKKIRRTDTLLPEAKPDAIFHELQRMKGEDVVCFGHAPHMDRAIAYALGVRIPFTELKKSGVACLELDSVFPPRGKLAWVCPPKILRRLKH